MAGDDSSNPTTSPGLREPTAPSAIAKPKLLLGEGQDEVMFFEAILKHLSIANVQVEAYGGKDKLRNVLEELPTRSGFNALVSVSVTRDADASATAAFASVRDALQKFGLPFPSKPGVPTLGPPKSNVLIFPGGRKKKGMLEDLCLASVATDGALLCVEDYLRCVSRKARRKPRIPSKARVQVWLASQSDSDLRLGVAAQRKIWDWNSPAFDELKDFIRSL
jgi:hypothetical protein